MLNLPKAFAKYNQILIYFLFRGNNDIIIIYKGKKNNKITVPTNDIPRFLKARVFLLTIK